MLIPHIEGDAALIRHHHHDKVNGHLVVHPTHVLFVGNGAIEGGSVPLVDAIADATGKRVSERAVASIAAVIAQDFKARKYFALQDILEIIDNVGSLDNYLSDYYSFKSALVTYYARASESSAVRLRTSDVVERFVSEASRDSVGVITTNWDTCIWNSAKFANVIQLHGVTESPDSIVLPGEYASDEEVAEVLESLGFSIHDKNVREQVQRMFRGDYRRPLSASLQTADMWLSDAQTIVIWGLGFHAYDSEVCQLAWNIGKRSTERKHIVVVNPSETDRDICKFLFSSPNFHFSEFEC